MIQLQTEDSEAAAKLVQQAQSPQRQLAPFLASSSESPEIIGVSMSYEDEMPPRINEELTYSSSIESPTGSPKRQDAAEPLGVSRRRSVKELVEQMHSQDPIEKAAAMAEMEKRGAVALHGLSFEESAAPPPVPTGLRVQSGQYITEVVGRLSEKQSERALGDEESREDSMDSMEESTLDDDAKLYQERLNNRNNNVLVKRDAASFRVKKDGAKTTGSDRPAVSRVAAARLHTKRNQHKTADAAITTTYTFEQLKNRTVEELSTNPYPADVDIENREQYLKDDEFFQVFGLTKADFNGIAKWRKTEMKKKKNLY